jgi:hypothetical protein
MNYYDITVVNKETRKAKSVPVCLDMSYDCNEGEDRSAVVREALDRHFITGEDEKHICEVENLSPKDYQELLEYNASLV